MPKKWISLSVCLLHLCLLHGNAAARVLFGVDVGERPVAVITTASEPASEEFRPTVEGLFLDTLLKHNFPVFDRAQLAELKEKAVDKAIFEKQDPEEIRRIGNKYQVDVLLEITFRVDANPGLGKYWLATADVDCRAVSTSTSRILGMARNFPMGVPGQPAPIGDSRTAAISSALGKATSQIMQAMGIPDAFIPPEVRLDVTLVPKSVSPGIRGKILAIDFHPLDDLLALSTDVGALYLCSARDQFSSCKAVQACDGGAMTAFAFQPGGSRIATGCEDGTVSLVKVIDGTVSPITNAGAGVADLDFSRSGFQLFVTLQNGRRIWWDLNASNSNSLGPLPVQKYVDSFVGVADQIYLIAADQCVESATKTSPPVNLFTNETGKTWSMREFTCADLAEDRSVLATAQLTANIDFQRNQRSDLAAVVIYDVVNRRQFSTLTIEKPLARRDKKITAASFANNWRFLATAGKDWAVRLWDVDRGLELAETDAGAPLIDVAASANSRWIAALGEKGGLSIFEIR